MRNGAWIGLLGLVMACAAACSPDVGPGVTSGTGGSGGAGGSGGSGGVGGAGGTGGEGGGPIPVPAFKHVWSKSFGETDMQSIESVAIDPATGDVVAVGSFRGVVDFGGGPLVSAGEKDLFVARFGPLGEPQWSKRFGDAAIQEATAVAIDPAGSIYVGGAIRGTTDFGDGQVLTSAGSDDAFVAKLDAQGNLAWAKRFGDANAQRIKRIVITPSGRIVLGGTSSGTINFGGSDLVSAGSSDIYVAELDAEGTHLFSRRFGGTGFDELGGLAVDPTGSLFITGTFDTTMDFGPVAGDMLTSIGGHDVFLAKLSANGTGLWARRAGDTGSQRGLAIAALPNGDVIVAGEAAGTLYLDGPVLYAKGDRGLFLARYSSTGKIVWGQMFGGKGSGTFGVSLRVDPTSESIFAAGLFDDSIDFGGGPLSAVENVDVFLARFTLDGAHLGSRSFGGPGPDGALTLDLGPQGDVVIGGAYAGSIDFGGGAFTTTSTVDASGFLARLSP
ncbi:hypothetical protein [Polyangium jinanense]|uniref:Cell surface protein n=1 Tax=Polyangium jinanense TaxID=2829994 RepID=A0A9X4ARY8_9BACT|nr:hypothetical protein [Polyangium jinanense]MDC3979945.1 hypothetical protein [Polyangium jinanense]MDC3982598.1 hypothetical protein [Polyangium jinanense]